MKRPLALFSMLVLIVPPVPAAGKSIMVTMCGDATVRVALPLKPKLPREGDEQPCCKKGCHSATTRKKKAAGTAKDCC